jgi:hypothetical protein
MSPYSFLQDRARLPESRKAGSTMMAFVAAAEFCERAAQVSVMEDRGFKEAVP